MDKINPQSDAEYQAALRKVIPIAIGERHVKAVRDRESMIGLHIGSGRTDIIGDPITVAAARAHPTVERRARAFRDVKTPEFYYKSLPLTRILEEPTSPDIRNKTTFFEDVARELARSNDNHQEVIDSLRALTRSVVDPATARQPSGNEASAEGAARKQQEQGPRDTGSKESSDRGRDGDAPSIDGRGRSLTKTTSRRDDQAAPEAQGDDKRSGMVTAGKAGAVVLGSILIADQLRRAKRKDRDDAPHDERESKIINYVVAVAAAVGVGALLFVKPEQLVKFVGSLSKLLPGGPSKA